MLRASLAMYDMFDVVRRANDEIWAALRGRLGALGEKVAPALDRTTRYDEVWLLPDLFLAQACGFPYVKLLRGRVRLIATPIYDFDGGNGADRASVIIVSRTSGIRTFTDLRGRVAAMNDPFSNSGMNLFRAALAPHAGGRTLFSCIRVTGGHMASIDAVRSGECDVASIDSVTWGLAARHAPDLVSGLRVLALTPYGPGLPLITRATASDAEIEDIRQALRDVIGDPMLAEARAHLGLSGLAVLDDDAYSRLEVLEREAGALGYPLLA